MADPDYILELVSRMEKGLVPALEERDALEISADIVRATVYLRDYADMIRKSAAPHYRGGTIPVTAPNVSIPWMPGGVIRSID